MSEELGFDECFDSLTFMITDGNQIYPSPVEMNEQDEIMEDENEIMA